MKIQLPLSRDCANSGVDDAHLSIQSLGDNDLQITLTNPDREVWVNKKDFLVAAEAIKLRG